MDGPGGGDHGFLVVHDDMAGLLGLTHHVEYRIIGTHIKVHINLHTSVMGMAGHGVPVRSNLKLGKTHSQLAGLDHLGMDVLVDHSLVAILKASAGNLTRLGDIDLHDRICGMCGAGGHIELRRLLGIYASEAELLVAHAYIDTVAGVHFVLNTVNGDDTLAADVDTAKLAALKEIISGKLLACLKAQVCEYGHHADHDNTVGMAVNHTDIILGEKVLNVKFLSESICGVKSDVLCVGCVSDFHSFILLFNIMAVYGKMRQSGEGKRTVLQALLNKSAELHALGLDSGESKALPLIGLFKMDVLYRSVIKDEVSLLPIGIVGEIGADVDHDLIDLDLHTELHREFKVLTKTAAPGVIGVTAVIVVLGHTVDRIALEEAGLFTRYEVCHRMGEILRHIMTVMRVQRDHTVSVDLGIRRLADTNAMARFGKGAGCVARLSFITEGDHKFKKSVRHIDDAFGKILVERDLHKGCIREVNAKLIALLVLALEALIHLVAVGLELDITLCGNQFNT